MFYLKAALGRDIQEKSIGKNHNEEKKLECLTGKGSLKAVTEKRNLTFLCLDLWGGVRTHQRPLILAQRKLTVTSLADSPAQSCPNTQKQPVILAMMLITPQTVVSGINTFWLEWSSRKVCSNKDNSFSFPFLPRPSHNGHLVAEIWNTRAFKIS